MNELVKSFEFTSWDDVVVKVQETIDRNHLLLHVGEYCAELTRNQAKMLASVLPEVTRSDEKLYPAHHRLEVNAREEIEENI